MKRFLLISLTGHALIVLLLVHGFRNPNAPTRFHGSGSFVFSLEKRLFSAKRSPSRPAKIAPSDVVDPKLPEQAPIAAGVGDGDGPGTSGQAGDSTTAQASALDRYKAELTAWIRARKSYPAMAKRLHQTGEVMLEFDVRPDGSFGAVSVAKACPHATLNTAARKLIEDGGGFRAFDPSMPQAPLHLRLPVLYELD